MIKIGHCLTSSMGKMQNSMTTKSLTYIQLIIASYSRQIYYTNLRHKSSAIPASMQPGS